MIPNKSKQAFEWSVETLFKCNKHIYFWTLTFVHVPPDDAWAMREFNALMKRIIDSFPLCQGVRVSELHRSHGIHFHLFLTERIPIRRMKSIAYGTGRLNFNNRYLDFGRMSVTEANKDQAGYLSKYLTKSYQERFPFTHRRWGKVGGFKGCLKNDIQTITQETRNRDRIFGRKQCSYMQFQMIAHYTRLWGKRRNWPEGAQQLIERQPMKNGKSLYANTRKVTEILPARPVEAFSTVGVWYPTDPYNKPPSAVTTS